MKTFISNPVRGVASVLLFLSLFVAVGGLQVWAQVEGAPQPQQQAPAYKVGTVTVKFVGTANVNEQVVRANMQVREGGDLDDVMLDRDIRSLYKTGLFEFIEVKREAIDGTVFNLVIEVTPKFRVLAIRYEGNKKVKSTRLEKEVKSKANLALDERQVKEDSEKLREYYQKSGYNQVSVNFVIERDRAAGLGTVIFKIKEGAKVKIADIRFEGNTRVKAKTLKREMETKKWWMFSWITGSGRFKDEPFEDDLDKVRDQYRELGYLDVDISQDKVQFDYPTPEKLVITITVVEGRQYHIGEINFSGNKLHPSSLLKRVARQKPGFVFTPSKLDSDVERLEDFYGKDGYLDTRIRLLRKPNIATGNIDIEYQIQESEKFNVESIVIEGNNKTKSTVILRELVLGPGDVFSTVLMKISKLRLENTRFFEDVSVTPQETNIPGRRNMRISVKEGRTGNLTFGAGFSSLEKATVFAEISQSNFDLFNRHSVFQGDGQKFRLKLTLGSLSSEVVLSFEEPYLFQKQLALGFSLFRTSADYNSTYFTQIETGGEVYLRKHLWEQFEGKLAYTYQIIDIKDVSSSASSVIQDGAGQNKISKVGFQLLRDTRDKIINTTSGNRVEVNTEVAGGPLGGSDYYYRFEFRGSQFFPVFETQAQVLSLIGRVGIIEKFGNVTYPNGSKKDVAYYNKFYLGGPTTLRGFEHRDVSPRDAAGEPVGGKSYGFFSAEYSFDIVSPIRFALFYDGGFVNHDAYDFKPDSGFLDSSSGQFSATNYNDNIGFGLRLFVAGAPLSLDFGIPLTATKDRNTGTTNKKGNQFNFSFGTRF